jgi:hypothetical protein
VDGNPYAIILAGQTHFLRIQKGPLAQEEQSATSRNIVIIQESDACEEWLVSERSQQSLRFSDYMIDDMSHWTV